MRITDNWKNNEKNNNDDFDDFIADCSKSSGSI